MQAQNPAELILRLPIILAATLVAVAALAIGRPLLAASVAPPGGEAGTSRMSALQEMEKTAADGSGEPGLAALRDAEFTRLLKTFFERTDHTTILSGLPEPPALDASLDVSDVLRRLSPNWEAPFEYVRSRIRGVVYKGSVLGARGTLLAGAANALDRALLLRDLYRLRGIDTRLIKGRLDWTAAERLVGGLSSIDSSVTDPSIRWVELAAEHWWIEADREGAWVSLDPAFSEAKPGKIFGHKLQTFDSVPAQLVATARISVFQGSVPLVSELVPTADVVGQVVELHAVEPPRPLLADLLGLLDDPEDEGLAQDRDTAEVASDQQPREAADLGTVLQELSEEKLEVPANRTIVLLLKIADRSRRVGSLAPELLQQLLLSVEIETPVGVPHRIEVPHGGSSGERLVIALGAGAIARRLIATPTRPLRDALESLAEVENWTYEAWRELEIEARSLETDSPDFEEEKVVEDVPQEAVMSGEEEGFGDKDAEVELHPIVKLGEATLFAWGEVGRKLPRTMAWIALAALDSIGAEDMGSRVIRPGIRLAGVRFRPPSPEATGKLMVRIIDPVVVAGADEARSASLQAGYGVLQSAILSQVLHRATDRAPVTAFDVTLRAFGTGHILDRWRPDDGPPSLWPSGARATVQQSLRRGYTIVGPTESLSLQAAERTVLGWWRIGPNAGETRGIVDSDQGPAAGVVDVGVPFDLVDLDSLLGSVGDLHHALRWLVAAGANGSAIAILRPAACAAAGLVAEALGGVASPSGPVPQVSGLCGSF